MTESLLDKAVKAAGLGVLVLDDAGRIIEGTKAAADLLGRDVGGLIGQPIVAVLPISAETVLALEDVPSVPVKKVIEVKLRSAADHRDALAVELVHWADPDGRRWTTAVLHDVSTQTELARVAQRELIRSDHAIRGANIGVFEYDIRTDSVSVSPIWRRMLELELFENTDVQQEWRQRVHPDDLAEALRPIRLCGEDLVERASCEYRLASRDRSRWRWMRTEVAVSERDAAGRPAVLVGAQTDITDRREAEDAFRVTADELRAAFDYAPIGKAVVGLDGSWVRVNAALCDLLGFSEAELRKTDFQTLTHPDDLEADLRLVRSLIAGEIATYTIDKRYIRSNGDLMWGRLNVALVRDSDGQPDHFISQIVDITEERRLDEMRSEFVSVVSHELRTPLTAILGSLMLLSTHDQDQFSDEVQRLLFIAKVNGDRLHQLINDILDFQKFSARQMPFSLGMLRIGGLVEETLIANLSAADRYGVHYVPIIPDRSLTALVDPRRFQQIMANLLSNAAKFAVKDTAIEVSVEHHEGVVRVSVSNFGPGIPPSFKSQVFTPFSQASGGSDRRSGGTGLGLSITKQIVEQMGGRIGFESVPDGKTTFWFTLRTAEDAREPNEQALAPK